MSGKARGVAAGLVLGTAAAAVTIAGAVAAAASVQGAAHWRIVKSVKTNPTAGFTAVVATGKTTGWAFDGFSNPTAWQRHGGTWTKVAFPSKSNEYVAAVGAASPSDVWAFIDGLNGGSQALRWDGHTWSVVRTFTGQVGGASVLGGSDVWVFGQTNASELGVWHYNGHTWSHVGTNLAGGSALSATDAWAYSQTGVDHWNGHTWTATSVKRLLPHKQLLNNPTVTGIIALSAGNVYAVGNGYRQDECGPLVVLHFNGHTWARVAHANVASCGTGQQISTDGSGGLWLPMPGAAGAASSVLHYASGKLTRVPLPISGRRIRIESVANIPGTTQQLAGGVRHAPNNPVGDVAVILQYR
jgi:hypothetical protein